MVVADERDGDRDVEETTRLHMNKITFRGFKVLHSKIRGDGSHLFLI